VAGNTPPAEGQLTVTFTWDVARSIPQVIDDGSLAYVYGLGRISQVAADDTTYYYLSDGLGSTRELTNSQGQQTVTYTYDAQNNVLTVTDNLDNVTTYTYDAKGSLETVTDANDKLTTYDYDDADRLTSVVDALDQTTSYEYDANGNRTSVTNARDKTTTYAYDALNRLESVTDPLSRVTSYEYDAAGNLSQRTDGNEQTTTYTYDAANRLTDIDYPLGTADVSFTYDAVGNRETMGDGTGTTSYDYDALNRLTSATFPGSRTVDYEYDNVGNRTSITYPGGSNEVTYAYDEAHNLDTVTDWNEAVTTYTYDDAGQLAEAALPNDVVSTYAHDGADRLSGISHVKGENTLASVEYTLDAVGNRTERVDQLGTHTYDYDDLYRLTEVVYPGPSTTSYTYDAVGNRETLEDGSGTTSYDYDEADQLTSVTPPGQPAIQYSWDDNGNLLERAADTYDWDAGDRMTTATVGGVTTDMSYTGGGLRDSRTVGEETVTFTWDVARSVPQVIDDGSLAYVYGVGRISQVASDDTTYYYLSDGLASTMALTDADGDVVNTYDYDVFGSVRSQTGSQPDEFRFTGEQADGSTALEYLRARYYDPATARFLSRDPIGSPYWPGHPFGYVENNPVNLTDPLGLYELTEAEREWCYSSPIHAKMCWDASLLREESIKLTERLFPVPWVQVDNAADAFRHCYLSGIMTLQWGAETAFGFGCRHEDFPGNPPLVKGMDLWNNYFGRLAGEKFKDWEMAMWHYRRQALQYVCYAGTWNGVLVITPEDPRLKYWSW
jgi:RHS repeat-associated protein